MAALLTTLLLAAASVLLLRSRSAGRFPPRPGPNGRSPAREAAAKAGSRTSLAGKEGRPRSPRAFGKLQIFHSGGPLRSETGATADPWLMPMLVHQLASLLEAGRSPQMVWAEAAASYVRFRESTGDGKTSFDPDGDALLKVLLAADRSAALGHSVAPVLRSYGAGSGTRKKNGNSGHGRMRRIWTELAACWDVAELSGAPLSRLLSRYAAALEAELDADSARQTALAGPRATVKLLAWLPLFGLGLGLLMGVDPLGILLGTPVGFGALAAGALLMVAGRFWSQRMVAAAEGLS